MLSASAAELFDSPSHIYEVIWDGIRAMIFIERREVRVQDRYGRDITARYPELHAMASNVNGSGVVLDGMIVCLDDTGKPDFSLLHRRLSVPDDHDSALLAEEAPITFQAFDILFRSGISVMDEPLRRRKNLLRQVARLPGTLAVPDFVEREGVAFFEAIRQHGLEGIIAKERDGRYSPGKRSRTWQTMKVFQKTEFVVGGFTYGGALNAGATSSPPGGAFTSLVLGQYDSAGALRYVGDVSGGFGADTVKSLSTMLDRATATECPFTDPPPSGRLVFWCRPELIVSVRFAGWSPAGKLRFPVFEWVRPDIPPASCQLVERPLS